MPREPWKISREMFLSEDETASLLAFLRTRVRRTKHPAERLGAAVDRAIIETLLFSGLRNSEFCQLKLQDVPRKSKPPILIVRETPRQNRTVFIPRPLCDLLDEFVRDVRPQLLPASVSATDPRLPLVVNDRGNAYERTALYRRVVRILTDAGLADRASVQLLRHTYGYLAYKRTGGNLLFVQQQLGHAHPMVTAVYAEFVSFPGDELANRIAGLKSPHSAAKPSSRNNVR